MLSATHVLLVRISHTIHEESHKNMANPQLKMKAQDGTSALYIHTEYLHTDEDPAALMLDPEGRIQDCNESAEALFGFHHDELVTQPVAFLLPQLSDIEWIQNGALNPRLSFFCHIGRQFNAIRRDGTRFASRLFLHDLHIGKIPHLRLIIRRAEGMA